MTVQGFSPAYLCLTALIPIGVVGTALTIERHLNKRNEKPPQAEKLLRPAGFSLSRKLDQTVEAALGNLLTASAICPVAAVMALVVSNFLASSVPKIWLFISVITLLITATLTALLSLRVLVQLRHTQNLRLGLRGEQAVAEVLHEVGDAGYRIFHDLPGGDNWNIDHVAVGPRGVFMVETKTRRRRRGRSNHPSHVVRVDANTLIFSTGRNADAIPQAQRNAKWLAAYLTKKTGEPVHVDALVVLPGLFVENMTPPSQIRVLNTNALKGHLRHQRDCLPQPQMVGRGPQPA